MADININGINHIALTVSDKDHARNFYSSVLGFDFVTELGPKTLLKNGALILALSLPEGAQGASAHDRFDENRAGLDHVSFNVASRQELEQAIRTLDKLGIPHGEIRELTAIGIDVLPFRDPDNIQLELTAARE